MKPRSGNSWHHAFHAPTDPLGPDDDELLDPEAHVDKAERARRRVLEREKAQRFLSEHPNHPTVEHIVDNRVFLLGLDQEYRKRMKRHESTDLLACARAVAARLNAPPADGPIEGYYAETRRLTEYFRLVRGLRAVDGKQVDRVSDMPEFQRLLSVVSAPIYGQMVDEGRLLPTSRDPLAQALYDTSTLTDVSGWTLDNLVHTAHRVAVETGDISLVGLAALARDAVVVAAVRESVSLYAESVTRFFREPAQPPIPVFVWRVDEEVASRGARFVASFNELFDEDLPEPNADNADLYFAASEKADILERCICIGRTQSPTRFYHWAVYRGLDGDAAVKEFWDTELWTTERYSMR